MPSGSSPPDPPPEPGGGPDHGGLPRSVPAGGRGTFDGLRDELAGHFRAGAGAPLDEEAFGTLALRVFAWQCEANRPYGAFCRARGASPERVTRWEDVPPVPSTAFKHLSLLAGDPARVDRVFRTSGTTAGQARRGEHPVPSLALYRAAAVAWFRHHLLPQGERLPLVSLVPSPGELPDSSLSTMVGFVADELAAETGWYVTAAGVLDEAGLEARLERAEDEARPVLVAGTAFALVHWMDALDRRGRRARLPEGSRIMQTGGFKGRSRTLGRDELRTALAERLGVPPGRTVEEYGMTELLSQFYEPTLREPPGAHRRLVAPPWVRTRVLDPWTLDPVPPGREGLLCHFDLANVGSVAHVLTEDLGVAVEGGFRVLGRTPGAEPRGCSLAMDELMAAAARRPG